MPPVGSGAPLNEPLPEQRPLLTPLSDDHYIPTFNTPLSDDTMEALREAPSFAFFVSLFARVASSGLLFFRLLISNFTRWVLLPS